MSDGFLGRWAKRKEAVRKGEVVPPSPQPSPAGGRGSGIQGAASGSDGISPSPLRGEGGGEGRPPEVPIAPTLEEANALTPASDFTRFAQPGVAPEVRTAALKKLFTDPHFNTMDGLDVYIGDYSKPDPIPPEMLRKLASAQFLKLFDEKEEQQEPGQAREVADAQPAQTVAQSGSPTAQTLPPAGEAHADPDLQLQQDDAPGPAGPGGSPR